MPVAERIIHVNCYRLERTFYQSISQSVLDVQIPKEMASIEKGQGTTSTVSIRFCFYVDGMFSHLTNLLVASYDMQRICG